jgi:hypothetical protein
VSSSLNRLRRIFPPDQFLRYLCAGVFNTVFAYSAFALILFLLNHLVPQRYLYLTVLLASIIALPPNITVAYFRLQGFRFPHPGQLPSRVVEMFRRLWRRSYSRSVPAVCVDEASAVSAAQAPCRRLLGRRHRHGLHHSL